jgi:uncharacterized sulfatase
MRSAKKPAALVFSALRLCASAVILLFVMNVHAAEKPNIVYIMADDLGYGDLGCYGQKLIHTPNIDKLRAQGMKFTQWYAGCTVCAPSRCVLMTGLHMGHCTVRGNAGESNGSSQALKPDEITIPKLLKQAGYATGASGKWGLGDTTPEASHGLPEKQGFDFFFGYYNQKHAHNYYPPFLYRNGERIDLPNTGDFKHDGSGIATVKKVYSPDLMLAEGLRFIEANKDRPFFYYAAWTLPHANNEANGKLKNGTEVPDLGEYKDKPWTEPNKGQAAMISYLDMQVGKLLAKLEELGLAERTIVFFTSDNGPHKEAGNDPDFFDANGPVRDIKRAMYDGGIRVPMIIRWPGKVAPNSLTDLIAYHGDVMATVCELAGVSMPSDRDSISIVPTLLGKPEQQKKHDYLYWEFYEQGGKVGVRYDKWKGVRKPWAKGGLELYDITDDIGETRDVAADHPDIVKLINQIMNDAHRENPLWPKPTGNGEAKGKGKKKG